MWNQMSLLQNPKQRKLLFSAGLSWMFDAMDVGMISFVVAALAKEWSLGPEKIGYLTSINSVGMAVGAAAAGIMADRFGRKSVLLWTLLIFSIASGLSAFAAGYAVLCVLRFIAGFGLGGELPVASTLVSESMPVKERGRAVVLLESLGARLDSVGADCVLRHSRLRLAGRLRHRGGTGAICALSAQGNR